jgi:periplasmic divalent cation tolerance protein
VLVLTTVATEEHAAALAHGMVGAGLAECVQMSAVRSVYQWKGAVCDEPEWRLAIKTTGAEYAKLEQYIRTNPTYATPEIVQLSIVLAALHSGTHFTVVPPPSAKLCRRTI